MQMSHSQRLARARAEKSTNVELTTPVAEQHSRQRRKSEAYVLCEHCSGRGKVKLSEYTASKGKSGQQQQAGTSASHSDGKPNVAPIMPNPAVQSGTGNSATTRTSGSHDLGQSAFGSSLPTVQSQDTVPAYHGNIDNGFDGIDMDEVFASMQEDALVQQILNDAGLGSSNSYISSNNVAGPSSYMPSNSMAPGLEFLASTPGETANQDWFFNSPSAGEDHSLIDPTLFGTPGTAVPQTEGGQSSSLNSARLGTGAINDLAQGPGAVMFPRTPKRSWAQADGSTSIHPEGSTSHTNESASGTYIPPEKRARSNTTTPGWPAPGNF